MDLDFAERQAEHEQAMTMKDWAKHLDRILTMSGEQLLSGNGSVTHEQAVEKATRDWFLVNEFADFGDPYTNFFMSRRLPKGFVEDMNVQQKVVEYFASFDEHIKDFRIEKIPQEGESKEERYKINALHQMIDSDEMAEIPLGLESAGTLKMFALYPKL